MSDDPWDNGGDQQKHVKPNNVNDDQDDERSHWRREGYMFV